METKFILKKRYITLQHENYSEGDQFVLFQNPMADTLDAPQMTKAEFQQDYNGSKKMVEIELVGNRKIKATKEIQTMIQEIKEKNKAGHCILYRLLYERQGVPYLDSAYILLE